MTRNDYNYAIELEERLTDALGEHELLQNLIRAMSLDEIIENFEYIARCFDIETEDLQ